MARSSRLISNKVPEEDPTVKNAFSGEFEGVDVEVVVESDLL